MYSFLLAIIYIAFISLGLPDTLLGSAWPVMQIELNAPVFAAGVISMIISACTIISSLISDRVTKRFGTGRVTAVSVLMTALALFGFSVSKSVIMLCILAIPYGLGAGAVDATLNNYVALHYSSRHMSWLHCSWGIGAAISPYIMSISLTSVGWTGGYRVVGIIQIILAAFLFITLPLWKKDNLQEPEKRVKAPFFARFRIKGVKWALLVMFGYCSFEATAGLWASSFLVNTRNITEEKAASLAALFYIGITFGRFISGFISDKLGDKCMIRYGTLIGVMGVVLVLLPFENIIFSATGLVLAGVGGGPVYPSVIHSTPTNFGEDNSQAVIGLQMASAYTGTTLMPPIFGLIADFSIWLYPLFLMVFVLITFFSAELLNKTVDASKR